jgi:2'-5' RNA ligase
VAEPSGSRTGLLIPVPEAEALVGPFRALHTPAAGPGTPAHITLLFPFVAVDAVSEEILGALRSRFAGVAPFDFVLARTARFMEVVYLAPEPDEPFRDLVRSLSGDWPGLPPSEGAVTDVLPHLTVAYSVDASVLDGIDRAIQGGLPIACRAAEAWLMADGPGGWSLHTRFQLRG